MPETVAVARDICAPNPAYSVPVDFNCSLACTDIGWPMQGGVILLNFYKDDPLCPTAGVSASNYIPGQVSISLGCRPGNPSPEGVWIGRTFSANILIPGPPTDYGMTFRYSAVMTVASSNSVTVTVTVERLVPNAEYSPSPPSGDNVYAPCGSFSTTLTRIGSIPARNVNWVLTQANLVAYVPSGTGSYCDTDIKSVAVSMIMFPFKIGCDGRASNGAPANCSLDTGYRTYSCMGCLVEPMVPNAFPAQWRQMGFNTGPFDFRCFDATNSGTGLTPPIAAVVNPPPVYPAVAELLNCGCPNEDPVNTDAQQIQFVTCAGYDVILKSVNASAPCLAVRVNGGGNPWTVGAYTVDAGILADTGHWVATCAFPSLAGQPKVVLYGMEFPSGILAECVPIPSMGLPPSTRIIKSPTPDGVSATMLKMREVRENPCVYLGEALETTPSCGCSGGIMHACGVHGKCRVSGSTIEMNCWRCPSYQAKIS